MLTESNPMESVGGVRKQLKAIYTCLHRPTIKLSPTLRLTANITYRFTYFAGLTSAHLINEAY